jgi:hypothetical protein
MSIIYCEKHDQRWDSDKLEECPSCESSVQPYWMRCKTCGSHVMSDARIYRVCDGDPETGDHDCQLERIDRPVLTPAPSEKPREGTTPRTDALCRKLQGDPPVSFTESDAEELAQHARELEFALGMWEWVKESARTNADHAVIVRFIKEGEWSYLHGDPTQELERELAQTRLERDAARNVLARAIDRERLANMRATEWEEAAEAAQEVANRETLSAAYWKDKASAVSATTAIPADIAEAVQSAITSAQIGELAGWEIDLIERRICSHAYKLRTADNTSRREGKS